MRRAAMTLTLVIPTHIAAEVEEASRHPLETAGVLLATVVASLSGTRLLARELSWVPQNDYAIREADSLSIVSTGYVPALGRAEQMGSTALWLHTHPGIDSRPVPSDSDRIVDSQIADLFRMRTGSPYYGSLIISPVTEGFSFSGRLQSAEGPALAIDRIWIVGDRFRMINAFGLDSPGLSHAFDRNVRAFGPAVQQTLSDLHIGIVGCGGTGSSIAEQLVRLGVRRLTLIDPEELATSNVTRVYGSTPHHVGQPKVGVLAQYLTSINSEVELTQLKSNVILESVAKGLLGCDLVFGCTDDNAGRLVLSRLATYFITPVIDCGVLLTATPDSRLAGIDGRVTTLVPGQACLVCRRRIDLRRAAAEVLTPQERTRLIDEGYAPALGAVEPAVVAYTTAVGAAAVSELLERLIGYGPEPRPSEILLRFHEREISTNRAEPSPAHYCSLDSGKLGIGITNPFLDQLWPG
jgi:molybdopterin/thiamine biosynthesis adenylyltransferase